MRHGVMAGVLVVVVGCGGRTLGSGGVDADGEDTGEGTASTGGETSTSTGAQTSTGSTSETSTGGETTETGPPPPPDLPPEDCPGLFGEDEDPALPKAVAPDQPGVYELAQDDDYVVWVSYTTREAVRLSKCDGAQLILDDDIHLGHHVAIASGYVVITESYSGGRIMAVNLQGGGKFLVRNLWAPSQPDDLDADDLYAYWIETGLGNSLRRTRLDGAGEPEGLVSLDSANGFVTLDGNRAYVVDGGTIEWVPKNGGMPQVIGKLDGMNATRLQVDATHAYSSSWIGSDDGIVFRVPIAGGEPEILADGQSVPTHVAIDADHVYWTSQGEGTVARMPKAGGEVEVLAGDQGTLEDLEVDEQNVYWTSLSLEAVMVRALP